MLLHSCQSSGMANRAINRCRSHAERCQWRDGMIHVHSWLGIALLLLLLLLLHTRVVLHGNPTLRRGSASSGVGAIVLLLFLAWRSCHVMSWQGGSLRDLWWRGARWRLAGVMGRAFQRSDGLMWVLSWGDRWARRRAWMSTLRV